MFKLKPLASSSIVQKGKIRPKQYFILAENIFSLFHAFLVFLIFVRAKFAREIGEIYYRIEILNTNQIVVNLNLSTCQKFE